MGEQEKSSRTLEEKHTWKDGDSNCPASTVYLSVYEIV